MLGESIAGYPGWVSESIETHRASLHLTCCSNEELLKKYDLKPNDAILAEEKHMGLYDDLLKTDAKLIPGGAAQNTARGAAVSFQREHSAIFNTKTDMALL